MNPNLKKRHASTQHLIQFFAYEHLPANLQAYSKACYEFAEKMVDGIPDGPELTAGLRKLLEAKDCFVRASIVGS